MARRAAASLQGAVTNTGRWPHPNHARRRAQVCNKRSLQALLSGYGHRLEFDCLLDPTRWTKDEGGSRRHRGEHVSKFRRSAQSAPDRHVDYRRGIEAHEPAHTRRCDAGVGVQAGEVTSLPCHRPRRSSVKGSPQPSQANCGSLRRHCQRRRGRTMGGRRVSAPWRSDRLTAANPCRA
jgi:hypothetical protein